MKLNLIFIIMDMLTILAYPIVFVYGRLRQFSRFREKMAVPGLSAAGAGTRGR